MLSREYDGIAEAGGVKNVVCSLSEELSETDNQITLFIPEYGCTSYNKITDYVNLDGCFSISCNGQNYYVSFAKAKCKKIDVIFVKCDIYKEKQNVYTYCQKDLEKFPEGQVGSGYNDWLLMDIVFQKAICIFAKQFNVVPEVVHCHDACVACFPAFAKVLYNDIFADTKMVVSIHNAGPAYHHEFSDFNQALAYTGLPEEVLFSGMNRQRVEPYLLCADYATLSTVSYDYAQELLDINNHNTDGLSEAFCARKIPIAGITNGIDTSRYLPEDKNVSLLPFEFSPKNNDLKGKYLCREFFIKNYSLPDLNQIVINNTQIKKSGYLDQDLNNQNIYFSFHGRLVRQKGILIIIDLIDKLFAKYNNVRLIINGQGEPFLENELSKKALEYPGKIVYLCGYERSLARLCTACGDFALFPSEFEPCGLEDFIAQIYGTIPIAHATGGLKKIINGKTGFTYSPNNSEVLLSVIDEIVKNKKSDNNYYDKLIVNASKFVEENYTWKTVANSKYMSLYK